MPGWESTRGNCARHRRIDESTAQSILNLKGSGLKVKDVAGMFSGATVDVVYEIWRRRTWTHLRQQDATELVRHGTKEEASQASD